MGEIIGGAIVLLVIAVGGGTVAYLLAQGKQRRELAHTPAPALTAGNDSTNVKLRQYYRLSQRSVRVIENLLARDRMVPCLDREERSELEAIVNEFYEL